MGNIGEDREKGRTPGEAGLEKEYKHNGADGGGGIVDGDADGFGDKDAAHA